MRRMNCNMNIQNFQNKKILIFCPHEDDEINIAGGLLLKLKEIECVVKVIYSTNGDYFVDAKYRVREAINSLKKLGVAKENIIFLGYPDCYSEYVSHLYMSNEDWVSPKGIKETYLPNGQEYHYKKHKEHCTLNRSKFISDIFEIIEEERADILICVDYDEHSDHRALSLSFENAMGKILNQYHDYCPIVLKAFAYPTAFNGMRDFKNNKLLRTKFNHKATSLYKYNNPYYKWGERISIDILKEVKNKLLIFNPLFRAMVKHVSQPIYFNAYSIINSDQVFFLRRCNNLMYKAKVKVSSGDSKYLNDFLLFDSRDIMHGETKTPILNSGYMSFEKQDTKKQISIEFPNEVSIEEIKLYKYVNCTNKLNEIILVLNESVKMTVKVNEDYYTYIMEDLDLKNIKKLLLIFPQSGEFALTEIEIFEHKTIVENDFKEEIENEVSFLNKIIFYMDDVIIFLYKIIFKLKRLFMK